MRRIGPILAFTFVLLGLLIAAPARNDLEEKQARSHEAFKQHIQVGKALSNGEDRRDVAKRFQQLANEYPETQRGKTAKELAELLFEMAKEDEKFAAPKDMAKLPERQLIEYYIYKLRDVAERDMVVPGSCNVLRFPRTPQSAAVALRKMGKPAVPTLIGLLEDRRPTRTVGAGYNGAQVLRYCDAALQILEAITGQRFGDLKVRDGLGGRGRYLSNIKSEYRSRIISRIKTWWADNQLKNEAEWIRDALAETGIDAMSDRIEIAEHLIKLQGRESVQFFRERLRAEPDSSHVVRLLWQVGGKAVLDDIRPKIHHPEFYVRVAAYRALLEAGDPNIADIVIAELSRTVELPDHDSHHTGALAYVLILSDQAKAVAAAARLIKHRNPAVVERALISFQTVLSRQKKPSPQVRKTVFPYMAGALDSKDLGHWAAWWLINAADLPIEHASSDKTKEQRERMFQQLRLWWQDHKNEYPTAD